MNDFDTDERLERIEQALSILTAQMATLVVLTESIQKISDITKEQALLQRYEHELRTDGIPFRGNSGKAWAVPFEEWKKDPEMSNRHRRSNEDAFYNRQNERDLGYRKDLDPFRRR